jgi:hypothetical protein
MMKFPSKKGPVLMGIITVAFGLMILSSLRRIIEEGDIFMGSVLLAVNAFLIWTLATTAYSVEDGVLMIKAGPFKWRIPVADIESVKPTWNPVSSPALSMDRLQITYRKEGFGGYAIIISPKEKERFIQTLLELNPAIRREGK